MAADDGAIPAASHCAGPLPDHAREAYVFTTGAGGDPVYHVLMTFRGPMTAWHHWLMVDRGEVPKEKLDPATRADLGEVRAPR